MKKYIFLFSLLTIAAIRSVSAQEVLPGITVKEYNGKVVVSWQNAYNIPITNISIQRSFDSTRNFSSIGTVLNPQNLENGFADNKPPYNKMYYRLFISFEGGSYVFSSIARPLRETPLRKEIVVSHEYTPDPVPDEVKEPSETTPPSITANAETAQTKKTADSLTARNDPAKKPDNNGNVPSFPWQASSLKDSASKAAAKKDTLVAKVNPEVITYPSQRLYTGKENNLIIHLKDAATKRYSVKFYDDNNNFLFELTKLKEEFLVVEKVNFVHSGWFHFELFESGKLIEKNKFFIGKDGKNGNEFNRKGTK